MEYSACLTEIPKSRLINSIHRLRKVPLHAAKKYPDVEKVNFVVSQKKRVSEHIIELHEMLKARIWPPLDALVGDLWPGDMETVLPLQFADVLCWHLASTRFASA